MGGLTSPTLRAVGDLKRNRFGSIYIPTMGQANETDPGLLLAQEENDETIISVAQKEQLKQDLFFKWWIG